MPIQAAFFFLLPSPPPTLFVVVSHLEPANQLSCVLSTRIVIALSSASKITLCFMVSAQMLIAFSVCCAWEIFQLRGGGVICDGVAMCVLWHRASKTCDLRQEGIRPPTTTTTTSFPSYKVTFLAFNQQNLKILTAKWVKHPHLKGILWNLNVSGIS